MTEEIFNKTDLLKRLMGNKKLVNILIDSFFYNIPKKINTLKNALALKDITQVQLSAHTIKGSAGMVSARAMEKLAAKAESAGSKKDLETAGAVITELEKQFDAFETVVNDCLESYPAASD